MSQNPMQRIQEFLRFKADYDNNPHKAYQDVQQMLSSGQMNQQQLNQLQGQATEFIQLLSSVFR